MPKYTHFEGVARAKKKTQFFVNIFRKAQKSRFWPVFFYGKFACDAQKLAKTGSFRGFGRPPKINLVDIKKRLTKTFQVVFEIRHPPPSREKTRSAPA